MATVSTGIAIQDQMTSVLSGITRSLNLTLSAMDSMQNSMDRTFDSRSIDATRNAIQQTEASIKNLIPPTNDAEDAQRQLNDEMKKGQVDANGLLKIVGKIAVALAPIFAVGKVISGGFDRLVGIDTATAKLQALGHSGEVVNTIMDNAITSVTGTAFRMEAAANTAASAVAAGIKPGQQLERYLSLTADAAAIAGVGMGEMGAIFNKVTTSGMIQAQELNQIADRGIPIFQMLANEMGVTASEVRGLASDGQVSADTFLRAIESGFGGAAQVMGTSSLRATLDNIGASISRIGANFLNGANDGQGFFDQVKPLMVNLLNALKTMEARAAAIGTVIGTVFGFIHENWPTIEPIIWGIVAAMAAWYIATNRQAIITGALAVKQGIMTAATYAQTVATIGLRASWQALNATMRANVIIAVISLLVGLGVWIYRLWQTNDQFAAGFMRTWNSVLNFFGKVPIYFARVGYGIANAFDDAKVLSLKLMEELVNGVIDGVNWLIEKLNKLPFIEMEAIGQVEYASAAAIDAEAKRQAREAQIEEMEVNAAIKATEREQKVIDMLESRAAKRAQKEMENAQVNVTQGDGGAKIAQDGLDIDYIGEIGKIRDKVDISSEDIKMMRELAEMKNIQNFVTLQPQMSFGDTHVRQEGRSVEEIVANITEQLAVELESSARGVYT